ncbi:MAG: DHA2 family efflux MFS transporter permease subunit [Caulobacteraceae bacterium]|nr:DHA2 family efflux MFS transporter permease subunit [Caulobacteraceae bacterium]
MSDTAQTGDPNRALITGSIMLATVMNSLDSTIANVALPHIQGSVSASADQITWVLTSYIVAAAIMTPMTGWLAGRFGRKQVFLVSIAGFTVASALCGAAQSLEQIVGFRLLQGLFGAALVPLSQAVLMDIYPPEEQGPAMAIWGMGAILGPIIGPALGGWLTDNFSWRWVFYINLPFGLLAFLGVFTFIREHRLESRIPFDFLGFAMFSIAIGGFQLFLDRGADKAWFESTEIWIEACISAVALALFAFHTITADRPFIPVALMRNGNFVSATLFGFVIGVLLFSTLALLPPFLETLMGYPVVTTGLVTAPRGVGSLVAMFLVGRLINRIDVRLIILTGLTLSAIAFWGMTKFSLGMGSGEIIWTGVIQGFGIGLIFVPLTTLAFATLNPSLRSDGAGVFTLMRNLGSSAGISIMQALHTNNTELMHSALVEHVRPDNPVARAPFAAPFTLADPMTVATLDGEINRQASMVAYIDDFYLLFLLAILLMPSLLLMRSPRRVESDAALVLD